MQAHHAKEVKIMKYETPELKALTAINAIQSSVGLNKGVIFQLDRHTPLFNNDAPGGYADWE